MPLYYTNEIELTALANKIREKTESISQISYPNGFINAIDGIDDLGPLEIYVADFISEPPIITKGALNTLTRTITGI